MFCVIHSRYVHAEKTMQLQSCRQFPEEKRAETKGLRKKLYYKAKIVPITIKVSPMTFS